MRLKWLILALTIGLFLAGSALVLSSFAPKPFEGLGRSRVLSSVSNIIIGKDLSVAVKEEIAYRTYVELKGLIRHFPTKLDKRNVSYSVQSVNRRGADGVEAPCPNKTETVDAVQRLYMGSDEIYLPPSVYHYTVDYIATGAAVTEDEMVNLTWHLGDLNWREPADQVVAFFQLPPILAGDVPGYKVEVVKNPQYPEGNKRAVGDIVEVKLTEQPDVAKPGRKFVTVRIDTKQSLEAYEAIKVSITWPSQPSF
jgi:hypothetical protein